ncbi:GTPase Rab1/YPT1, small G protein superfamily [Pelomyxa schiedti]|nr:GTPase Rab1/YPT1, small G protein superfamily [Pelomyxa schiedti]
MDDEDYDKALKLIIIGDANVGKTSLVARFTDDTFSITPNAVIGASFKQRTIRVEATTLKLRVWDTAGEERFRALAPSYLRNSDGVIIVFDITTKSSFESIRAWIEECQRETPGAQLILIGNKCDREENRVVAADTANKLADEFHISFMECSAKESTNVDAAFMRLVTEIIHPRSPSPPVSAEPAPPQSNSHCF